MIKYSIKTEQELIDEFGGDWRNIHSSSFIVQMDYLLGTKIDEKIYKYKLDNNRLVLDNSLHLRVKNINSNGYFGIISYMIKELPLVNYNEKRTLIYE